ncbi:ATP phosphoribosyltransferase regulatory subunit [Persephonella marina]|uniref:ATP phosphoribosyltransferase regulatory subunit n=1 Tax=Persephonella marina TaxID=309805 RepID=UPI003CCD3145
MLNIDIPAGVRVYNRIETSQIKYIQDRISEIFERWGYEEITLPSFEFFSVHSRGFGEEIENRAFKFIDRNSGEILTLRADFTSQIARYFASLKKKTVPKRYYYSGDIFRYVIPKADRLWERKQMGVELIGVKELEADAEVIAVAVQSLENLGIKNYQIDINNVKIFDTVKDLLGLDRESFITFMDYVRKREVYSIERFISDFDVEDRLKEFVVRIPEIQGDITVIQNLKEELKDFPELIKSLESIEKVYNILSDYGISDRVIFDIGEPKEFSYYTGIVFEIFIRDYSRPIGQGGRYDSLISKYDGNIPATGFAFDLLNIWEYMKLSGRIHEIKKKDFFIIDLTREKRSAYRIGKILREKGYSVGRDIVKREFKKSLEFAFEEGYSKAIVIGLDSTEKDIYIYSSMDSFEKLNLEEFLRKI